MVAFMAPRVQFEEKQGRYFFLYTHTHTYIDDIHIYFMPLRQKEKES